MTTTTARPASAAVHRLAEGPVWDSGRARLLWVDIPAGEVHEGTLVQGRVETIRTVHADATVGAVVPARDGRLLVAGRTALVGLTADGRAGPHLPVLPDGSDRRLNDGACDPGGRFLVGSLALGEATGAEVLCRLEDDGGLTVLDGDLTLSNGLAWSPDGALLYSVDTMPGTVWVRDYDAASGAVGPRRLHLQVGGLPDGLCTDVDGNLWVAVWGQGQVRCYAPSGALLHTVEVSAPHTSSVAFAGDRLDTLVITTACDGLTAEQRRRFPDSGRLFTAVVGARGLPTTPWNGRGMPAGERSATTEPGAGTAT